MAGLHYICHPDGPEYDYITFLKDCLLHKVNDFLERVQCPLRIRTWSWI